MRIITQHPDRVAAAQAIIAGDTTDPAARLAAERDLERIELERSFTLTERRAGNIEAQLQTEINDALTARFDQEQQWLENMRQYDGVPRNPFKAFPIENAPNIELTIGAISTDTIYAQSIDILTNVSPFVRVQCAGTSDKYAEHEKHLQRWTDWVAENELRTRQAMDTAVLDNCKHGSGALVTLWTERTRVTDIARITQRGPRTYPWALDDIIFPGGAQEVDDTLPWFGLRSWLTPTELKLREKAYGWNLKRVQLTGATGRVRATRESIGNTRPSTKRMSQMAGIIDLYGTFDVDGDGIERDLLVTYNFEGSCVVAARWMPYDRTPLSWMRYQRREHLIYGIGIPEMTRQFQEGATMLFNEFAAGVVMANMRGWKGPQNELQGDTVRMRHGKYYAFNRPTEVDTFELARAYPEAFAAAQALLGLADRRSGVNEVSSPRPSSMLGNRTPGITALTLMQQATRRFTPAFESMREAIADSVRQGLYRYHERIRMGDAQAINHIISVMGDEGGQLVLEVLRDPHFDEHMVVELEAASATANAMQERQDAIQLANILGSYYDKVLQLMSYAAQQGLDPVTREVALKVAKATGAVIERAVSKFEIIRNTDQYIIDLEDQINAAPELANVPQDVIANIAGAMSGVGGAGPSGGRGGPALALVR